MDATDIGEVLDSARDRGGRWRPRPAPRPSEQQVTAPDAAIPRMPAGHQRRHRRAGRPCRDHTANPDNDEPQPPGGEPARVPASPPVTSPTRSALMQRRQRWPNPWN